MAQHFKPWSNKIAKLSVVLAGATVAGIVVLLLVLARTPYFTREGMVVEQPIPFSHEHHVRGLGIDCRYCHTSVEDSSFAGIPPAHTCMTCHSQVWNDSEMLAPVREAYESDRPIPWKRVNDLADFAYFDHSIHIERGVKCTTCHGPVEQMPLVHQDTPLTMAWCLECHRDPTKNLVPPSAVFTAAGEIEPKNEDDLAAYIYNLEHVQSMTNCTDCHR